VFVRITGDTSKNKNQAYRRKSVVADGDEKRSTAEDDRREISSPLPEGNRQR